MITDESTTRLWNRINISDSEELKDVSFYLLEMVVDLQEQLNSLGRTRETPEKLQPDYRVLSPDEFPEPGMVR